MDNQHKKIDGYRDLDQATIAKMNAVKAAGRALGVLVEELENDPDVDQRFVAIAKTHFQLGGMALTRSIAKPDFFF